MTAADATTVVTRFAPSPTGYLHVGGARTALFNWAFARRHGGRFLLRIEDTDRKRSTERAAMAIVEQLQWLGIDWDGGPALDGRTGSAMGWGPPHGEKPHDFWFQSTRDAGGVYPRYLERLRAAGRVYRCFRTPDELASEKAAARAAGRPERYDPGPSRDLSESEARGRLEAGERCTWRFAMPGSDVTVRDAVLGDVTVAASELEDFVLVKADGGPTFHFANVVDDLEMGVTHVLRGQEHLMNTPRHLALFEALGATPPTYATLPLILNPDGSKMSKRHKAKAARKAAKDWLNDDADRDRAALRPDGVAPAELEAFLDKRSDDERVAAALAESLGVSLPAIDVVDFQKQGYLPEVLSNYLALLGWSPGEDVERFDMSFLAARFDLGRLQKAPAKFDRDKLAAFNADTLQQMDPAELAERLRWYYAHSHPRFDAFGPWVEDHDRLRWLVEAYRQRVNTLDEVFASARYLVTPDDEVRQGVDAKTRRKVLEKGEGSGYAALRGMLDDGLFETVEPWAPEPIEAAVGAYAERTAQKMGTIAQPLRVAVTGSSASPPIGLTLALAGRGAVLERMRRLAEEAGRA